MLSVYRFFDKAHPAEPGTLAEQLAAVEVSLHLAERRGTRSADQWDDARRLVIKHVREAHHIDHLPTGENESGK